MSIRKTTIIAISITFLALITIISVTIRSTVLAYLDNAERQSVQINIQRALESLNSNFDFLSRIGSDWAYWDSTYQFTQDLNSAYITENLVESTFSSLEINLLIIIDLQGRILYQGAYDAPTQAFTPIPDEIRPLLAPGSRLTDSAQPDEIRQGTLQTSSGSLQIVSFPVLRSDLSGSPGGHLIIGKILDRGELLRLGNIVKLPISLEPYREVNLPDDFSAAKSLLTLSEPTTTLPASEDRLAGFALINDVENNPTYILKIEQQRSLFGSRSILFTYLYTVVIATTLIFLLMTLFVFEKFVLNRVLKLNTEVIRIGKDQDFSQRVTVSRKDELAELSANINEMLTRLVQAQNDMLVSEARFRTLIGSINDLVFTYDQATEQIFFLGQIRELGELPENIAVHQLDQVFSKTTAKQHRQAILVCLKGEQVIYDWSFENSAGEIIHYQNALSPIRNLDNQVSGAVCVGRNITYSKNLESNMRQRIEELGMLHHSSQLFLAGTDKDEIFKNVCDIACENFAIQSAVIYTFNENKNQLEPQACSGGSMSDYESFPVQTMEYRSISHPILAAFRNNQLNISSGKDTNPTRAFCVAIPISITEDSQTNPILVLFNDLPVELRQEKLDAASALANLAGLALAKSVYYEEIQNGKQRLEKLSNRLIEVQEQERRFIALELHDEIGQVVTGLKLLIDNDYKNLKPDFRNKLDQAKKLTNELIGRVRQLSLDLRPTILDDFGLLPALLWLFDRSQNQFGLIVHFTHSGIEDQRFEPNLETVIYRVVQEGLTNVARHAQVNEVEIQIWQAANNLLIKIEDQGIGCDLENLKDLDEKFGLIGIQERVHLIGGKMQIETAPGKGTSITAEIPFSSRIKGKGNL
jgi:PAS domain S-box-containing protein